MSLSILRVPQRPFRSEVFYEWFPPEIIVEVPVNARHGPHEFADRLLLRTPAPDGHGALIVLEIVDNTHRAWFDARLQYRVPPIDTRKGLRSSGGLMIRIPK